MSEQDHSPELRHLQPLYQRYAARPELLFQLEQQFGLRRVAANAPAKLPAQAALQLSEYLYQQGDPHAMAWIASQLDMAAGDGIVYYLRSAMTLRQALGELHRLGPTLFPDGSLALEIGRDRFQIRVQAGDGDSAGPVRLGRALRYEAVLVWLKRVVDYIAGQPVVPLSAALQQPLSAAGSELVECLGVVPETGLPHFALAYPLIMLDSALPGSSMALHLGLRAALDQRLSVLRRSASVISEVLGWLDSQPNLQEASLANAAAAQHVASSTLRRQLAQEGTHFTQLLNAYRKAYAVRALINTDEKPDTIAHYLGYAERSIFERAFRQWCGLSPMRCRRLARELGAAGSWDALSAVATLGGTWQQSSLQTLLQGQESPDPSLLLALLRQDPVLHPYLLGMLCLPRFGGQEPDVLDDAAMTRLGLLLLRDVVHGRPSVPSSPRMLSLQQAGRTLASWYGTTGGRDGLLLAAEWQWLGLALCDACDIVAVRRASLLLLVYWGVPASLLQPLNDEGRSSDEACFLRDCGAALLQLQQKPSALAEVSRMLVAHFPGLALTALEERLRLLLAELTP